MGAKLNSIDIVSSAMRAVNQTLVAMLNITLDELPAMRREEYSGSVVLASEGTYISFVALTQSVDNQNIKGGICVYISKSNVSVLFNSLGITDMSLDTEIRDICGEFCNIVTGGFKTEIVRMGYNDVQLTLPQNSADDISEWLGGMTETQKYRISFAYKGRGLLVTDIYMGIAA